MSVLVANLFDEGVQTALAGLLDVYLVGVGIKRVTVSEQASKDVQTAQQVVVSATELEEMVYQSGHYRAGVEIHCKVDRSTGTVEQFRQLSGAVLDFLQLDDLPAQLTAVKDATGRGLCVVQGTVLEQARLEDVGDDQWRRVYSVNVFGFNPAG